MAEGGDGDETISWGKSGQPELSLFSVAAQRDQRSGRFPPGLVHRVAERIGLDRRGGGEL